MQDKILQLIESDQESAPLEQEEDESEDQPYADQVFEEATNIVEKKSTVVSEKRISKVRNTQSQSVEMLDQKVKAAYEDLGSEQKNSRSIHSNRSSKKKVKQKILQRVNLSIDTEEINRESLLRGEFLPDPEPLQKQNTEEHKAQGNATDLIEEVDTNMRDSKIDN